MDKVKDLIMEALLRAKWEEFPTAKVEEIADDLIRQLQELCTDLTPKADYPEICVYCVRPAIGKYGPEVGGG